MFNNMKFNSKIISYREYRDLVRNNDIFYIDNTLICILIFVCNLIFRRYFSLSILIDTISNL